MFFLTANHWFSKLPPAIKKTSFQVRISQTGAQNDSTAQVGDWRHSTHTIKIAYILWLLKIGWWPMKYMMTYIISHYNIIHPAYIELNSYHDWKLQCYNTWPPQVWLNAIQLTRHSFGRCPDQWYTAIFGCGYTVDGCEILRHLGWLNPYKWDKPSINWGFRWPIHRINDHYGHSHVWRFPKSLVPQTILKFNVRPWLFFENYDALGIIIILTNHHLGQ